MHAGYTTELIVLRFWSQIRIPFEIMMTKDQSGVKLPVEKMRNSTKALSHLL
jgi:hypothetical protein